MKNNYIGDRLLFWEKNSCRESLQCITFYRSTAYIIFKFQVWYDEIIIHREIRIYQIPQVFLSKMLPILTLIYYPIFFTLYLYLFTLSMKRGLQAVCVKA